MKKLKIAIFGASSHIAKGLIFNFLRNGGVNLYLYTRSAGRVRNFLKVIGRAAAKGCIIYGSYKGFIKPLYDVVINCVGVGTLNKLQGNYSKYFTVTEEFDNLAIKYLLSGHQEVLYINFSSGVVYGGGFLGPAGENTINHIKVNHIVKEDYYTIARLNAEAKHRSFEGLRIADLRLFSYFSRFIDLTDKYFITEILNCIKNKKVFVTDELNIVRDYVHPDDLFLMVKRCMGTPKINGAYDLSSRKPVKKMEILEYFSAEYGLKYKIKKSCPMMSATGQKDVYYSKYNIASNIGYKPSFSSMETIMKESKYILGMDNG